MAAGQYRHDRGMRRIPRRGTKGVWGMSRSARIERETKESKVVVELDLDGTGTSTIETGVPFFDHMLAQLSKHSGIDMTVSASGDVEVDSHHVVEDVAIV